MALLLTSVYPSSFSLPRCTVLLTTEAAGRIMSFRVTKKFLASFSATIFRKLEKYARFVLKVNNRKVGNLS